MPTHWKDESGRTPYQVLGLLPHSSTAEISERARLLVKVWHEDRVVGDSDQALLEYVRGEYQQVMKAWNLLRNPRERADYDRRNKLLFKVDGGQDLGPKGSPEAWYRLSHFLKEEDLGKSIHRSMAYKQGDALERDRELSEKQKPYAEEAWAIGEEYGFDPHAE